MDLTHLSKLLTTSLGLRLPPIAVSFTDEAPPGLPSFAGSVAAGCSFWELAAERPIVTSTQHHESCSIGVFTHNLAGPGANHDAELSTVLNVLREMQYVRDEDIPQIAVLKRSWKHVVYSPLEKAPLAPDVVLLFAQASQGLVIAEAVQQVEGGAPPALGRPACSIVPQVVNSGKAALSLGCCGARAYLSVLTDDIALWAVPGNRIAEYAERISVLAKANQVLAKFHALRMADVQAGLNPTYQQSLARLQA